MEFFYSSLAGLKFGKAIVPLQRRSLAVTLSQVTNVNIISDALWLCSPRKMVRWGRITFVVFFPQTRNSSLIIRKTSDTSQ